MSIWNTREWDGDITESGASATSAAGGSAELDYTVHTVLLVDVPSATPTFPLGIYSATVAVIARRNNLHTGVPFYRIVLLVEPPFGGEPALVVGKLKFSARSFSRTYTSLCALAGERLPADGVFDLDAWRERFQGKRCRVLLAPDYRYGQECTSVLCLLPPLPTQVPTQDDDDTLTSARLAF